MLVSNTYINSIEGVWDAMSQGTMIDAHSPGKAGLIVGLSEEMGLVELFNKKLSSDRGRPEDIPNGVMAQMMMVNMCDDHHPLWRLDDYYAMKDLEGLFHYPIRHEQINDDRFGHFLDRLQEAGPREIFSQLAANAFLRYDIQVKNINYDTTSKVMWGTYETEDGKLGEIEIDFGHSKQKRPDKKQIKLGIGTAEGIVVDGQVLSGNKDDKTWNNENLELVEDVLSSLHINKDTFCYIADSALFSEENLKKAAQKGITLITRMPDNVTEAKELLQLAVEAFDTLEPLTLTNAKDQVVPYRVRSEIIQYKGYPLACGICYSASMKEQKEKSQQKKIAKEGEELAKKLNPFQKRTFACEEDARLEIQKLSKDIQKLKFHQVQFDIKEVPKRKAGRPAKDAVPQWAYQLVPHITEDEKAITSHLIRECTFILASNRTDFSATQLLQEYKTQSQTEKKFQQLKSPHFVNAMFLDSPKRIEAFAYLMLMVILLLSVAEYIVRREMKKTGEKIVGLGKREVSNPTLFAIYTIFYSVRVNLYEHNGRIERRLARPLFDNVKTVLKHLGIPEDTFTRGAG